MLFPGAVISRPPAVRIVDGFLESKVGAREAAAEDDIRWWWSAIRLVKLEIVLPTATSNAPPPSCWTAHPHGTSHSQWKTRNKKEIYQEGKLNRNIHSDRKKKLKKNKKISS